MHPINHKIPFILSLTLLINHTFHVTAAESSSEQWILEKFHVSITNELPGNSPMEVHCKSGDDDLGDHTLGPHEAYGFKFRLNFIKTTRFWCHFRWVFSNRRAVGDVFWPLNDFLSRCGHHKCVWVANEEGLGFLDPKDNYIFVYYEWE